MRLTTWVRFLAALAAFGLIAAACGDDSTTDTTEPAAADEPAADEPADEAAGADLSGVCPDPFVIQSDWFPESEHGGTYNLLGSDYTIDTDNLIVTGSLTASGGIDTGIDLEVRAGGPAIGFVPTASWMYTDESIHLGFVPTDAAILLSDAPVVGVVATLETSPLGIQWDPETYPDVETIADIGEAGIVVNMFAGSVYIDALVSMGLLTSEQIDPSYDGSPARWIVEDGAIAQQLFVTESPYSYEFIFEDWGKPLAWELLHDAGLELYQSALSVRKDKLDTLGPCLEQVVPIIQQSIVDFADDPSHANAIIIDAVEQYASFWTYDAGLAEYSVDTQKDLGIIGNGLDDTVGNFDVDRVNGFIEILRDAGLDFDPTIQFEDIASNEFIDEDIGF